MNHIIIFSTMRRSQKIQNIIYEKSDRKRKIVDYRKRLSQSKTAFFKNKYFFHSLPSVFFFSYLFGANPALGALINLKLLQVVTRNYINRGRKIQQIHIYVILYNLTAKLNKINREDQTLILYIFFSNSLWRGR